MSAPSPCAPSLANQLPQGKGSGRTICDFRPPCNDPSPPASSGILDTATSDAHVGSTRSPLSFRYHSACFSFLFFWRIFIIINTYSAIPEGERGMKGEGCGERVCGGAGERRRPSRKIVLFLFLVLVLFLSSKHCASGKANEGRTSKRTKTKTKIKTKKRTRTRTSKRTRTIFSGGESHFARRPSLTPGRARAELVGATPA
jgi:hypothetical protein